MRLFAAKVRLNGSLYNEVRKSGLTVPEIIVLRAIHGGDGVAEIVDTGDVKRTAEEERDRLSVEYGAAIRQREEIVGGLGALIGFAGPLAETAPGIPAPAGKPAKSKPGKDKIVPADVEDEPVEDEEEDVSEDNPEA